MNDSQLILASSSPQRKALLQQIGFDPHCIAADIDETRKHNESAADYALLSDTQHSVLTGVTVASEGAHKSIVCETKVEFGPLTTDDIRAYWDSGEPQGKAGSYAIQGIGAVFVKGIHGSYSNVVGLPVHEVASLLQHFGMPVLRQHS